MKRIFLICSYLMFIILTSCQVNDNAANNEDEKYDEKRGVGAFKSITISSKIDDTLVQKGEELYKSTCASCHSLSKEVVVGPSWLGVTKKREAAWLMNFMTNTQEMLQNDPELKRQIEKFKTQMPDFKLTETQARSILEFMRKNDQSENQ